MLTREALRAMQPGYIFAMGAGHFPDLTNLPIMWIAVRGGTDDWAIYYQAREDVSFSESEINHIRQHGDKAYNRAVIQEMANPDKTAMERYRE